MTIKYLHYDHLLVPGLVKIIIISTPLLKYTPNDLVVYKPEADLLLTTVLDWYVDFELPPLLPTILVSVLLAFIDCVCVLLLLEDCIAVLVVLVLTVDIRFEDFGEDSGLLSSQFLLSVLSDLLFDFLLDLNGLAKL